VYFHAPAPLPNAANLSADSLRRSPQPPGLNLRHPKNGLTVHLHQHVSHVHLNLNM
jgi:hypothetical protein